MLRMTLFYTGSVWVWGTNTKHEIKIMNLLENSKGRIRALMCHYYDFLCSLASDVLASWAK